MEYNKLWSIFEETGDIEDYLEYVNEGEYYRSNGVLFMYDENRSTLADA